MELGDANNAAEAVNRAMELSPSNGIALLNGAIFSYRAELLEESLTCLGKLQEVINQEGEPRWLTQEVRLYL